MIFNVHKSNGDIDDDIDYDYWVNNVNTWYNLGDKLLLYNIYALASDLYGQGLLRDSGAFQKATYWIKFAKACNRCGRSADAKLAVKQALNISKDNTYLLNLLNSYDNDYNKFYNLINNTNSLIGLNCLINSNLPNEDICAVTRLQALYRGNICRKQLFINRSIEKLK
jgi:tetratricopeptide (TPR) repeat protein